MWAQTDRQKLVHLLASFSIYIRGKWTRRCRPRSNKLLRVCRDDHKLQPFLFLWTKNWFMTTRRPFTGELLPKWHKTGELLMEAGREKHEAKHLFLHFYTFCRSLKLQIKKGRIETSLTPCFSFSACKHFLQTTTMKINHKSTQKSHLLYFSVLISSWFLLFMICW